MSRLALSQGRKVKGRIGDYEIERPLEPGSLGSIYMARDPKNLPVIVKMPKIKGDELDRVRRERLMLETEILRRISQDWEPTDEYKHGRSIKGREAAEHVVRYLDEGDYRNCPFLVLEFLEGGRVKEVYSAKPASVPSTMRFIETLLITAEYLHSMGIIHRDINPYNVTLDSERELVLMDFGVAKWRDASYGEVRAGTRLYSAPEQFEDSSKVCEASDLFAIGATIFYMVSSQDPPEITSESHSTIRRVLAKLNSNLPLDLVSMLERAMDPNPERRFDSAKIMMREFESVKHSLASCTVSIDEKEYDIFGKVDIGREHVCDDECLKLGHDPLTVAIRDPNRYVSRHHIRIEVTELGAFLNDLGSTGGTAACRKSEQKYEFLGDRENPQKKPFKLQSGDKIALAYDEKKGPYKTALFNDYHAGK